MTLRKSDLYGSLWKSCDELRGGMAIGQPHDRRVAAQSHRRPSPDNPRISADPDHHRPRSGHHGGQGNTHDGPLRQAAEFGA